MSKEQKENWKIPVNNNSKRQTTSFCGVTSLCGPREKILGILHEISQALFVLILGEKISNI